MDWRPEGFSEQISPIYISQPFNKCRSECSILLKESIFSELCAKTLQQNKKEPAPTINVSLCNALTAVHESKWYLGARSSPQFLLWTLSALLTGKKFVFII